MLLRVDVRMFFTLINSFCKGHRAAVTYEERLKATVLLRGIEADEVKAILRPILIQEDIKVNGLTV